MKRYKIFFALGVFLIGSDFLFETLRLIVNPSNKLAFTIGMFIIQFIILGTVYFINKDDVDSNFKDFKINYKKYLRLAFLIWIIGFLVMIGINYIINNFILSEATLASNELALRERLASNPIYYIAVISLIGPIIEELVFRLSFNTIKNKYLYIALASSVFAALHILADINTLLAFYFFSYLALGLTFTLAYYKTKNIFPAIIIHIFHNSLVLLILLFF